MERLIFHVDVNSAFLSWEAARRVKNGLPDLRDIPSVIGGSVEKRTGIVLAKSIPAKQFGIVTGEPMALAMRKCPALVSAQPDFELYIECSHAFKEICRSYAPVMESFSVDEVFLDMTGTRLIYPDPIKTAHEIKDRIREELGFTVNIGIGHNKLLAKMASDFKKPDRVHTLFKDEIKSKMWPLPAGDLLFLGKSSAAKLNSKGINTIGQFAALSPESAQGILGDKAGRKLWEYANGIDDSEVAEERQEAKGYSAETTLEESITSIDMALPILLTQIDILAARLRKDKKKCTCVSVTMRTDQFVNKSHQRKLSRSTDITDELYRNVREIFIEAWEGQSLRLIGAALTDITEEDYGQFSLFEDTSVRDKKAKMDAAADAIRTKFGRSALKRASTLNAGGSIARKAEGQLEFERKNK